MGLPNKHPQSSFLPFFLSFPFSFYVREQPVFLPVPHSFVIVLLLALSLSFSSTIACTPRQAAAGLLVFESMTSQTGSNGAVDLPSVETDTYLEIVSPSVNAEDAIPTTRTRHRSDGWRLSLGSFTAAHQQSPAGEHPVSKKVRRFYQQQNKLITSFEHASALGQAGQTSNFEEGDKHGNSSTSARRAVRVSLAANVLLTLCKVVALTLSGSLSVLGSLVDSALDLFAGVVLWYTDRYMRQRDIYLYPMGKTRYETIATVIIAAGKAAVIGISLANRRSTNAVLLCPQFAVMGTAALEVLSRAIQDIAAGTADPSSSIATMVLLGVTVLVKLLLFLYCRLIPTTTAQVIQAGW